MDHSTDPLLTDRDKLTRLLSFLDIETQIGPGNGQGRHSSFPVHGRRSLATSFDGTLPDQTIPVLSPPLITQRLQTLYVDSWPAPTVKRGDTILYPGTVRKSANTLGGIPITLDTAVELRSIVYGSPMHSFSKEWQKATLKFYLLDSAFPYGIETTKCGARGLALCVQGYMLKHLIFDREYKSSVLQEASVLKPNSFERRRAWLVLCVKFCGRLETRRGALFV
ncbi:Inactive ubiquitin carboxyl-terminal hydrolase MINDY-4B [Bulinus truncatus]|nr:Inactive ubiquitin carboxyl-terminal hydrolase MINDY-4B [Bulinus truncatus]